MDEQAFLAAEQAVTVAGTAELQRSLQLAAQAALVQYAQAAGSADGDVPFERRISLGERISRVLREAAVDVAERILQTLARVFGGQPPQPVIEMVQQADQNVRDHIGEAARLAQALPIRRPADLQRVTARAHQAVTSVRRTAAVAVAETAADRARTEAVERGWMLVWVSERDACLTCLAYNGRTAPPHGVFAPATFGKWTRTSGRVVSGPPRHPHCKCQLEPIHPDEVDDPLGLPVNLRREAERAVLRGASAHASEPAKLAAADRLLQQGSILPKTVQERARRNLQRKGFAPRPIVQRPARPRKPRR